MVLGLGIDLLDHGRLQRELGRGGWKPTDGIFLPREITRCASSSKPALRFAACFAGKEAVLKALGCKVSSLASFRQVELRPGPDRRYKVVLHNRLLREAERLGVRRIWLSIAQQAACTAALVVLES